MSTDLAYFLKALRLLVHVACRRAEGSQELEQFSCPGHDLLNSLLTYTTHHRNVELLLLLLLVVLLSITTIQILLFLPDYYTGRI